MKKIFSIIVFLLLLITSGCIFNSNNTNVQTIPSTPSVPTTPTVQTKTQTVKTYNINVQNFSFTPATLTIKKGSVVTWINNDSVPHTINSTIFDSDKLSKNQSFSYTFNNAGTFDYYCGLHPSMKGAIIVE